MGMAALLIIVINVVAWLAFFIGVGIVIFRHVRRRGRLIILSGAGVTLLLIVSLVALNLSFRPAAPPQRPSPSGAILLARMFDSHGVASLAGVSARDGSVRWRSSLAVSYRSQAPIAAGVAYVTSDPDATTGATGAAITAVRLDNGARLWQRALPGEGIISPLALRGGALAFVSYSQPDGYRANALDLASHALRWSSPLSHFALDNQYPVFAASASLLYVGSNDGEVSALRLRDGSLAWSRAPLTTPDAALQTLWVALGASQLYAYTSGGQIIALRSADGALLWRGPAGLRPYEQTYLTPTSTSVYACVSLTTSKGDITSGLAALDPATGAIRWERAGACGVDGIGGLVESAGAIYQLGPTLNAMRVSDGAPLWSASTQTTDLGFTSAQVDSGVIFVAATVIFPHDYTLCGDWWTGGPLFCHSQPFIAAYDAATGVRYWRADVGDAPLFISEAAP